jgi:hypothetical protein
VAGALSALAPTSTGDHDGWIVGASSRLDDASAMTLRLERQYDRPTAGDHDGWIVGVSSRLDDASAMTLRLERQYDRPTADKSQRIAAKRPPWQLLTLCTDEPMSPKAH